MKIRSSGVWRKRDVLAELRHRKISCGDSGGSVTVGALKAILEQRCSIAGHPAHFKFEMPEAWRDACNRAAEIEKMGLNEVKAAAGRAGVVVGRKKKAEIVAEVISREMAVTVAAEQ